MKGHIKATCFKYLALQGNDKYQKNKAKQSDSVQLCIEILEDAVGMGKCEHCFQYNCTPSTCYFPEKQHTSMQEAHALFFDSDMHDICMQTKSDSWDTSHTNDWYANNYPPHEEAMGYWHDYEGDNREAWAIEAEEQYGDYYTDNWFEKADRAIKKRKKKSISWATEKLGRENEASGGESSSSAE
jgi:hypothetical protein